jgi:hypothetical protein
LGFLKTRGFGVRGLVSFRKKSEKERGVDGRLLGDTDLGDSSPNLLTSRGSPKALKKLFLFGLNGRGESNPSFLS